LLCHLTYGATKTKEAAPVATSTRPLITRSPGIKEAVHVIIAKAASRLGVSRPWKNFFVQLYSFRMFQRNFGRGRPLNAPAAFIHACRFVLLLLAVPVSAWATSAKASWIDWYDKPNSGYCETAPPGLPVGHYVAQDARLCPENLKRSGNELRQKPKRTSKSKSERARWNCRDCFLSVRGICTCF